MQYRYTLFLFILAFSTCRKDGPFHGNNTNKDLSLAGMVVSDGHLFLADNNALAIYSLQQPSAPALTARKSFTSYFDSLFLYRNELAATQSSFTQVYNIADPANVTPSGSLLLWARCDRILTSGQTAYVMKSGSNTCFNDSMVRIYDISVPLQPVLKAGFQLKQPQALAAAGNVLYVCDGSGGLAVVNVSDPAAPVRVRTFTDDSYYDLALNGRLLLCRGAGGLSCYDVSTPLNPVRLSKLPD